jgi:hypothetical protein
MAAMHDRFATVWGGTFGGSEKTIGEKMEEKKNPADCPGWDDLRADKNSRHFGAKQLDPTGGASKDRKGKLWADKVFLGTLPLDSIMIPPIISVGYIGSNHAFTSILFGSRLACSRLTCICHEVSMISWTIDCGVHITLYSTSWQ